jgi:hypothetical protein
MNNCFFCFIKARVADIRTQNIKKWSMGNAFAPLSDDWLGQLKL